MITYKKMSSICNCICILLVGVTASAHAGQELDAVESFTSKVVNLDQQRLGDKPWLVTDVRYDVKKTNSLLAPIQAELEFTAIGSSKDNGKPLIGNKYWTFPVVVKLHWSDERKRWIVDRLLTRSLGKGMFDGNTGPWIEPENYDGFRYVNRPGFVMDDLMKSLRDIFEKEED